jgi:hypothetical protein
MSTGFIQKLDPPHSFPFVTNPKATIGAPIPFSELSAPDISYNFISSLNNKRFFIPTDIPDCILWLDAMDSTTVNNGASSWKDKSKNNYIATNAAGSFSISTQNNLSYYTGTDFNISNFTMRATFTYFLVGEISDPYVYGDNGIYSFFKVKHENNLDFDINNPNIYLSTESSRLLMFGGGIYSLGETSNLAFTSHPGGQFFILVLGFNLTNSITPFSINGTDRRSPYTSGTLSDIKNGYRTKKLSFYIERIFPLLGGSQKYCECIMFDRSLSKEETQKVEGYLAEKWKLQFRLPTNHPHKNLKPLT